jgi:hypothetical protein
MESIYNKKITESIREVLNESPTGPKIKQGLQNGDKVEYPDYDTGIRHKGFVVGHHDQHFFVKSTHALLGKSWGGDKLRWQPHGDTERYHVVHKEDLKQI